MLATDRIPAGVGQTIVTVDFTTIQHRRPVGIHRCADTGPPRWIKLFDQSLHVAGAAFGIDGTCASSHRDNLETRVEQC